MRNSQTYADSEVAIAVEAIGRHAGGTRTVGGKEGSTIADPSIDEWRLAVLATAFAFTGILSFASVVR